MGAPVDGYPSLASFMASDPDQTATIFKRFNRLSARNLLYLQSELTDLDAQLNVLDEQDRGMPCARSWDSFKKRGQDEPERMVLIKKIRETMLEYSEYWVHVHLPAVRRLTYIRDFTGARSYSHVLERTRSEDVEGFSIQLPPRRSTRCEKLSNTRRHKYEAVR